jgi:acyl carrier protein
MINGFPRFVRPVSPAQIRVVMRTIPSWARIEGDVEDDTLFEGSGMDSLAFYELVAELQRLSGLDIPDDDIERISSIQRVADYLNDMLK